MKYDFDNGTVTHDVDFDHMTDEEVVAKLMDGVPAKNLAALAKSVDVVAGDQGHVNALVRSTLKLVVKGADAAKLLAAFA